ncbi:MAG: prephenate dehydrogenase/arogenate dehydrogenase family protein [Actinomycetota bacterium]|nr:prephenate dehydrogenase/arogenate dehydrogenase family protein [Actinomycetota bacterium]MDH5223258.1 prephenate dehydrogenase/arogenate dehydrogenase family protein [Actinomycetota bacterium]MDH5313085.1 prephenate dehydrogenase/arogenate dehydrogenase family protein [Actinomycetota bacterium]
MTSVRRVAVIGTGLIGTSVALASARVGAAVVGWDADAAVARRASDLAGFRLAESLEDAVGDADVVVVATPIPTIAVLVARCLARSAGAVVTDVGSVKTALVRRTLEEAPATDIGRFVPGHPMGGSERSGPEHASASVLDGIVWAITPHEASDAASVAALESWVASLGARPVRLDPTRHDRLVAFVSHLPQVASTALMSLAATEEADEPEILLLAAGGFRDLTRLAASNPSLWSDILLGNRLAIAEAIDLYAERLMRLRAEIVGERGRDVEATFDEAKRARLRLAAKPTVRAGVAVLQVVVPDRPGALANLTAVLRDGDVNIEDLQIVHSPEGGRGTVHLTVVADAADRAHSVLVDVGLDPTRLA